MNIYDSLTSSTIEVGYLQSVSIYLSLSSSYFWQNSYIAVIWREANYWWAKSLIKQLTDSAFDLQTGAIADLRQMLHIECV